MKRYLAAAAMAPLCFAAAAAQAQTTTTISDARTTPVQTSAAGDINIATTGSATVTSGAAVTLDSNNKVSNGGVIEIKDAAGESVGINITSPTGTVTSDGVINITDTESLKDADNDGDLDGPFVTASGTRFGIRASSLFTGNVTQSGGQIVIRGNNSAGILLQGGLTGNLQTRGQILVVGANSYGLRIGGPVVGNLDIAGQISVQGQNAEAVSLIGPVTGRLVIQGDIAATGFRYRAREQVRDLTKLDADDLLIGGPAVRIAQSVSGGVLVNGPQLNTDDLDPDDNSTTPNITDPNPDEDGDGIADDIDASGGTISSYGSAPALLIGSGSAITLGDVGSGRSAYGLVIQGNVVSSGVYDGVSSIGVQLGGLGGTVNTGSGVTVSGNVVASSALANATGLLLGAGATAPVLRTDGKIQATSTSSASVAANVTAVEIAAGASLPALTNGGNIVAAIGGPRGVATAVLDRSGTLSQITNTGVVSATISASSATDVVTGDGIAFDLRTNTSGVTFTQQAASATSPSPAINGDILFGSGAANLRVLQGDIVGDVAFGAGSNTLLIDGVRSVTTDGVASNVPNASVTGRLSNAGTLGVSVLNGALTNTNTSAVALTSLTVGAGGTLGFTLDPAGAAGAQGARYNVAGAANLASGAKIDIDFSSKLTGSNTFTLIQAGALTVGGLNTSLLGDTPFIYNTTLSTNATQLNVAVSRRTAAEAGLAGSRAAAYEAFFDAFDRDQGVAAAVFRATNQAEFEEVYNQLLPDYAGGVYNSLASGARAVMRAQSEQPEGLPDNQRRSWLQEVGFAAQQDSSPSDIGYDSTGFGVAGGIEESHGRLGTIGFSAAFLNSEIENDNRRGDSLLTASALLGSVYWRDEVMDNLFLSASVTGGYTWFDSDRDVRERDAATRALILQRQTGGEWDGGLLAARLAAVYQVELGRFYVRPDAALDYIYLKESGYEESGGGASIDLAVNSRTSYEATAEAGVTFGARFGRAFRWGPEIRVGYRTVLADNIDDTTARFISGVNPFVLRALAVERNRLQLRAALRGGSRYANVALELGGEFGDVFTSYEGRLMVRFLF